MAKFVENGKQDGVERGVAMKILLALVILASVASSVAMSGKSPKELSAGESLFAMVQEVRRSKAVTSVIVEIDSVSIGRSVTPYGDDASTWVGLISVTVVYDTTQMSIPPMVLSLEQIVEFGFRDTVYTNKEKK